VIGGAGIDVASVARVTALGTRSRETRVIREGRRAGTTFPVEVPTHVAALAEFHDGATATMVFSFESPRRRALVEVTGSEATMEVPDPNEFAGEIRTIRPDDEEATTTSTDGAGFGRGIGVLDMARSIRAGGRPRASGDLGYHVLDVMAAIEESAAAGQACPVASRIERPPVAPADWAATVATL
jgi:predicted dehydrogenase